MKEIQRITIVTAQGVNQYIAHYGVEIIESEYSISGDPWPCYKVFKDGNITHEIRCVHNLEIEYK